MSIEKITKLTYENDLSHYGSSLGVYRVLKEIEKVKQTEDLVVLDEAHGALGYYVWLEEQGKANAQELFDKHGVHQNRDTDHEIWVSGGSLGLAGSISLGMALADRSRNVFVIFSDGALAEGIWAECLRIAKEYEIYNWRPYLNFNGYGAMREIDLDTVKEYLDGIGFPVNIIETKVNGLDDHYRKVTKEEYERISPTKA